MALLLACGAAAQASACGGGGGGPGPGPGQRYDLQVTATLAGTPVGGASVLVGLDFETAGADGRAVFPQLTAGNYTVSAQGPGGEFACETVALAEGATDFEIALAASSGFAVAGLVPALGSAAGTPDPELRLTLSSALDPASLSASVFSFTPQLGALGLSASGNDLTIRASRQLPLGQLIICQMQSGLRSAAGEALELPVRFAFRTPAADNAPPRLLSSRPEDGAAAFPPNLAVRLEFNETLAALGGAFSASASPPAELLTSVSGSSLLISAQGGWELNTAYGLELSGIADNAGNSANVTLAFTTSDTPAPADNLQPEWNRVLNEIVFASDALGSFDIFRVSPDGSGLAPLSGGSGDELSPTLSADGLLIAWQQRGSAGDWDIYAAPRSALESASAVTGGPANDFEPAFSRTFSRNLFFSSDRSNPQGLYMMGEDGSNPSALDFDFNSSSGQCAPHPLLDTQMLFTSAREGSTDVWRKTISVIDASTVNLNLTGDINTVDYSPAWAPDASFIVYVSDRGGTSNLWLADPSGGAARQVTAFSAGVDGPAVSPFVGSAECAVALANGLGGSDIVIIDLVGGTVLRNLTGTGDGG